MKNKGNEILVSLHKLQRQLQQRFTEFSVIKIKIKNWKINSVKFYLILFVILKIVKLERGNKKYTLESYIYYVENNKINYERGE